ncbi:UNVERIFIED_CONTAM: hypothetical protein GTU68_042133 [Idotea baltica]|nr:hypothetical protein [Idotea baltica]
MTNQSSFEEVQKALLQQLQILGKDQSFGFKVDSTILTLDVQYKDEFGYVGIDVLNWESNDHQVYISKELVTVDYEPGYFAFREGPILQNAVEKFIRSSGITPALLIIDGHGTAHPRKMGLASWLGIKMGIPSIGVAKESLLPIKYDLAEEALSTFDLIQNDEIVGTVLRTQTGIKPVFVSAGHLISQKESVNIIQQLRGEYRIIEPIRRADQAARKYAKGIVEEGFIELD